MKPIVRKAGLREEGVPCARCEVEFVFAVETVACPDCGAVHHWECWEETGGCSHFDCSDIVDAVAPVGQTIRITTTDLKTAKPLPAPRPAGSGPAISIPMGRDVESTRWNKLAIASFIIALIGIPLYGIVTGVVAIVVAAISLISKNAFRRRGVVFAAVGIVLGIADFVGWTIYLSDKAGPGVQIARRDSEPDPKALEDLPAPIGRAMKANVLIQTGGLFSQGIGSGVILRITNGEALVVTNRHVIDSDFANGGGTSLQDISDFTIKAIGQPFTSGTAVWIAPHKIDLALVKMKVTSGDIMAATWDAVSRAQVGEPVFAIGNPHGYGWTHTGGDVSQIRRQDNGGRQFSVIQTSAAINPGNSGGGLYTAAGALVGINTWTQDKRVAEGLGFAIMFQTLHELLDGEFALPEKQDPTEAIPQ